MSKQSDIARQFDLPERQSKLNTMLREEGLKDEQVYCVCRSSDVTRFMIGCDQCEEWYHGDCINVTEHEANRIRKFFCKKCRAKYPALQIKYKEKRSHHHHKHKHDKEKHRQNEGHKWDGEESSKPKRDILIEKCGECEACYVEEDCGRCECCKDMTKFGGTGVLRQKCKKRQCQNFYHLAKKHQQTSSTKLSSDKHSTDKHSSDYARGDHSYNTQPKVTSKSSVLPPSTGHKPTTASGSLIIKSLAQYSTSLPSTPPPPPTEPVPSREETATPSPTAVHKVNESIPVQTTSVTAPLTNLTNNSNRSVPAVTPASFEVENTNNNSDKTKVFVNTEPWEPAKKKKPKETMSRKRKELAAMRKRKLQDSESESEDPWVTINNQGPRQCMGPQCIKVAKPSSKYCGEECGLQLAEARIYSVLPQRIQEWKMSSCVAEENDRKQLEKIRSQQLEARKALQTLDDKHKELDTLLEKWKSVSIDPQADEEGDEEGCEGALIYCVTCGHEIPTRRAIRHMHSCYNKLESQMSFGSMFKTRIEGNNMFCDSYNPSNRTYCKRLRVMCPEHTKESKISNTEVCGFPLTTNVFSETGKVCRMSKKKCVKHYCWEKLRRANIDMERVRQCLKLDELVEQERQVRLAMTNRAGVLGLMLHSTYDHEYAVKIHQQQQKQQQQQHHQQQRPTDHQYHQKDKSHPAMDLHHKQFKDSTNYYQHQQIASDHHYHRQQQPEATQESSKGTSSHKKYQPKSASSSSMALGASSQSLPRSKSPNTPHTPSYQGDHYFNSDQHQLIHDHQYFSNQPNSVDKRNDHIYYSSKKHK